MPFPADKLEAAKQFLVSRGVLKGCQFCSWSDFELFNKPVAAPMIDEAGTMSTTDSYPLVVVCCRGCGHVDFFSAIGLGLLPALADG